MLQLLRCHIVAYAVFGDIHSCSISQKVYLRTQAATEVNGRCAHHNKRDAAVQYTWQRALLSEATHSKSICRGFTILLKYVEKYPCALLTLLRPAWAALAASVVGSMAD